MKELEVLDVNRRKNVECEELEEEERRRRMRKRRARQLAIKRRRQRRRRMLAFFCFVMIMFVVIGNWSDITEAVKKLGKNGGIGSAGVTDAQMDTSGEQMDNQYWTDKTEDIFLYEVEFADYFAKYEPEVLSDAQVYRRLKELAGQYEELEDIYEDCEKYPIRMLASLCNNPEMYEYVEGYLTYEQGDSSALTEPELTEEEKQQRCPLFLQWDDRWGYEEYGDFNIALSGCGPTALAMAVVAITGDEEITPDKVAEYSMENGFYVEGTGTAWSLMTDGAEDFSLDAEEISLDENVMKHALDEGKVIICSMRPGDFTSVGHFILIYDYDENGFQINDPNCIYRSSRYWEYEELASQIRILWSYESM